MPSLASRPLRARVLVAVLIATTACGLAAATADASTVAPGTIVAGSTYGCALRTTDKAACWGRIVSGVANQGTFSDRPMVAPADQTFKRLAAGVSTACGIRTDDTVLCFGPTALAAKAPPAGTFRDLAVARGYACGLRIGGGLACWSATGSWTFNGPWISLAANEDRVCALESSSDFGVTCLSPGTPAPHENFRCEVVRNRRERDFVVHQNHAFI